MFYYENEERKVFQDLDPPEGGDQMGERKNVKMTTI